MSNCLRQRSISLTGVSYSTGVCVCVRVSVRVRVRQLDGRILFDSPHLVERKKILSGLSPEKSSSSASLGGAASAAEAISGVNSLPGSPMKLVRAAIARHSPSSALAADPRYASFFFFSFACSSRTPQSPPHSRGFTRRPQFFYYSYYSASSLWQLPL